MSLHLRFFAVAADPGSAEEIAQRVRDALSRFEPVPIGPPVPYWKIPGQYGFLLAINAGAFDELVLTNDPQWSKPNAFEAIWNFGSGTHFLIPEVRWAHLEFVD